VTGPADAVARATGRAVRSMRRVAGGDINDAWAVELDGGRAFVKTRVAAPEGEYTAEAAALAWLGEPGALAVPAVLGVLDGPEEPRLLALEWLDEGPHGDEAELGRGLALVHTAGAPGFGAPEPLRLGPLTLPNDPPGGDDRERAPGGWPAFYVERRVRPLLGPAQDRGALSAEGVRAVERVCERIDELAGPPEPPARLHGDLWSGNVLWSGGRPVLIDPAAYGGHREVDLAMLRLFGSTGAGFLAAYEEVAPLADGHEDRVGLWQLFPLLVHAVLFGGTYGAAVERTARRYAG
jgi:fructosamine-3-kinase